MQAESVAARRFDLICLGRAAVDLYSEQLGCRRGHRLVRQIRRRLRWQYRHRLRPPGSAGGHAVAGRRRTDGAVSCAKPWSPKGRRQPPEHRRRPHDRVGHSRHPRPDTLLFYREIAPTWRFPQGISPRIHRLGPRPPGYRDAFFHPDTDRVSRTRHFLRPQAWRDGRF